MIYGKYFLALAFSISLLTGCGAGNEPDLGQLEGQVAPPEVIQEPVPAPPENARISKPKDICDDDLDNEFSHLRTGVCKLVNKARNNRKLKSVKLDPEISLVAQKYAVEMDKKGFFSHESPSGSTMTKRLKNGKIVYVMAGENIARGQSSPKEVMNAWMNSPGHRRNILTKGFGKMGLGFSNYYWVQVFTD